VELFEPLGVFPQNSIYNFSVNGTFADFPYLYQGFGPTFYIGYPFTLTLYLNTSTMGDRPALYFNYTLSNSTFRQSASFDYLVFNSTVGAPTEAASIPYYQADGYNYDPIGLINDMEIDILGNDDGDMTAFTAADATVALAYWNASAGAVQDVPSAYNAGQETGENSVGLAVYSSGGTNPFGVVRAGPSFVGGLWNYSAQNGAVADTVTVHPVAEYSFLFINIGNSENASLAQWVPTSVTGTTTFYLPTGVTYFLAFMMSEYDPASEVVTATASVTLPAVHLTYDPTVGIYAPLFAFSNAELASIASAGAGTVGNPYILLNNQYGSLAPEFATWNDFLFPEFPGLLIAGTTAYVQVTPPSFEIDLPSWDFAPAYVGPLGLPHTNNLQLQFYDATNIELVHAGGILGWMSAFLASFPESSVIFWNCTNSLVLSNTFDDQGNALLFYGGTANVVWGNTFVTTPVVAADPLSVDGAGGWDTGINETESGDLVYNNQFEVGIPAITITYDPFGCDQYGYCGPVTYNDTWNVTMQPASNYTLVDGWNLTGSIIGTWYQGGNYWSNYGTTLDPFGVLPYNNTGAITVGGDYVPLVPYSLYPVTFQETGLVVGIAWNVTENGVFLSTNSSAQIEVDSPNGTFSLLVGAPVGYAVTSAPSDFTVDGAAVVVSITFAALIPLIVQADGLPNDIYWSASVNGTGTGNVTVTQSGSSYPTPLIIFDLPTGTYNVTASVAFGYSVTPAWIPVALALPEATALFQFTAAPGEVSLEVSPANASVWVDGSPVTLTGGVGSTNVPPGFASIEATSPGYYPYFTNVSVNSTSTTRVTIALQPILLGTLSLIVTPGSASVWVDGSSVSLGSGTYSVRVMPGLHSIEVTAAGYYPYFNNVTVASSKTTGVTIALNAVSSGSSGAMGISGTGWAIIALVAVLAVIFLIGMVYFARRRPPRGQGVGTPPPAQPWQETPPNEPPPSN